jgi:multiple sugar transport system substrate-binding protein
VEVTCVDIGVWHDTIFDDFARGLDGLYDLVILDSQWIGEAVTGDHVVDLTALVENEVELSDYFAEPFAAYSEYPPQSKRYYGVPFEADVQFLVYRKDVWDAHGFDDAFDLEELYEMSRVMHESTGLGYAAPWCSDAAACYDQGATTYNAMAWSFDGHLWDVDTYRIDGVLQSDENVAALDLARKLAGLAPRAAAECDFGCVVDAICNGGAASAQIWAGFGPTFLSEASCPQAPNLAFSVVPGQRTHVLSLGGMGVHINAHVSGARRALALDFVRWQMTREQQREWTRVGGYSSRKSVLATGLFLNSAPYAPAFAVSYPLVRDFWNLPEFTELLAIEMRMLGEVFDDASVSSRDALARAAALQQEVIDRAYPNGPPEPERERVEISSAVLIAVLVVAGLLMLASVLVGAFVWMRRDVAIFRFSSPIFMLLILFGVVLMLSSLFTYTAEPVTDASCGAHLWLSIIGVCLIFAPLLAKTRRIYLLWRSAANFQARSVTTVDVFAFVVIITLPVILLLAVWSGVDPNEPARKNDTPEDGEYVVRCDSDNLGIYLGVLLGYLGLFLLAGCVISFLTRKVTSHFNESAHISLIMVNVSVMSIVIIPLIFFISDEPTVIFLLEAIGFIFVATLILGLLFGVKIYKYLNGKGAESSSMIGSRGTTSGSTRLAQSTSSPYSMGSGDSDVLG